MKRIEEIKKSCFIKRMGRQIQGNSPRLPLESAVVKLLLAPQLDVGNSICLMFMERGLK